jgi:hypothetical protein
VLKINTFCKLLFLRKREKKFEIASFSTPIMIFFGFQAKNLAGYTDHQVNTNP